MSKSKMSEVIVSFFNAQSPDLYIQPIRKFTAILPAESGKFLMALEFFYFPEC
jgi:hypothetical protein